MLKYLLVGILFCSNLFGEDFNVEVTRDSLNKNLIKGRLLVNGKEVGSTYERFDLRINPGLYDGKLRYVSARHAVGPFGQIGETGDFLLEIGDVKWSDEKKRSDLLFHAGSKPEHSKGCVMLGPVSKKDGVRYLPETHTLYKLRELFYGNHVPNATPDKDINITIQGFSPEILGSYGAEAFGNQYQVLVVIENNQLVVKAVTFELGKTAKKVTLGEAILISDNSVKLRYFSDPESTATLTVKKNKLTFSIDDEIGDAPVYIRI